MYQFSRSIYRELASEVTEGRPGSGCQSRRVVALLLRRYGGLSHSPQ